MAQHEVIRIRLKERSIQTLMISLLTNATALESCRVVEQSADALETVGRHGTLDVETHLLDDTMISYSMQTLDRQLREQADCHLQICTNCTEEVARVLQLSAMWANEDAVQTLERRVRTATTAGSAERVDRFIRAIRVSLKPLLLPRAAFGEGQCDGALSLEFPITERGLRVEGLTGNFSRSNREFYVCVKETGATYMTLFKDREVRISLSDPSNGHRILQRNIDIGVTVLLGAGLQLTEKSELEAELLPSGRRGWKTIRSQGGGENHIETDPATG